MRAPSQCNLQLQSDVKEAIKEADSERAAYQAFLTTEAAQTADPDTVAQMESEIAEVSVGPLERAGFEARVPGQWARRGPRVCWGGLRPLWAPYDRPDHALVPRAYACDSF